MSKPIPAAGTATPTLTGAPAALETSFYSELEAKANQVAGNLFKVGITPLSAGSLGGFNYIWQSGGGQFNQATYDFINSRVVPGTPARLSTQFSGEYAKLLGMIAFHYSSADEQTKNKAATESNLQATAVVTQYVSTYGPITATMLKDAEAPTSIDYIIQHVVAKLWSGKAAANEPALRMNDLLQARDLSDLLPSIPPSGLNLLPTIATYLSRSAGWLPLVELQSARQNELETVRKNTNNPTLDNGGIATVDAKGDTEVRVGYSINAAMTGIQNDLNNKGRVIKVEMTAKQSSQGTVSVSTGQSAAVSVPANWFLTLNAINQTQMDLYSVAGAGTDLSISVMFKGFSWVPIAATQYQQDTKTGWMNAQLLAEAAANQGQDKTGMAFIGDPPCNLGKGGNFGVVTGVLISNYPSFTITYKNGDYSRFEQSFQKNASWNLSFLGTAVGSYSQGAYQATLQQNGTSGGFSVTFEPSPELLTVPDLQKQAYVIGGSIAYPGTGDLG
jgi:hypothetical protein